MIELLERVALQIPEIQEIDIQNEGGGRDSLIAELALRSAKVLGYTCLQEKLDMKNSSNKPLGQALRQLDIEPFSFESVEKYKVAAIQEQRKKFVSSLSPIKKWLGNHPKVEYFFGLFVVVFYLLSLWFGWLLTLSNTISVPVILCIILGLPFTLMALPTIPNYQWTRFDLAGHQDFVEPFVLDRALQIAAIEPSTKFFVEKLTETKDPFLVATLGKEEYYIDVFEETAFEYENRQ